MKNCFKPALYLLAGVLGSIIVSAATGATKSGSPPNGAAEFQENCAGCHADGGNIINPAKTLSRKDRAAHGINTANDIIKIMRNPGEGMTQFDEKTLPQKDAEKIAEYIIATF